MTTLEMPPTVHVPPTGPADQPDVPRSISHRTVDDRASLMLSGLASLGFVWVVYENILAFSGVVGFVVLWWVVFLAIYAGASLVSNPVPIVLDRLAASVLTTGAVIVGAVLVWLILYTVYRGWPALHHLNFYTENMTGIRNTAPLDQGGIWYAIVGSAEQVGLATAISLPLGVGTAIFLAEVGGKIAIPVRTVVEAMTAVPDVLAGLFIYTLLIIQFHWQRDGFAVALALAVTMTPIVARSSEVVLRVVPGTLREASLALGASNWQTVRRIVLPTARSGLATSLILGIARVTGESAPLLIVSATTTFFKGDPFQDPQMSLPLFIYTQYKTGQPVAITRAYGAATVLLALVLILFIVARLLARDRLAKTSRFGQRSHTPSLATGPNGQPPADIASDVPPPDQYQAGLYGPTPEYEGPTS